jgi:hypothetical protein
MKMQKRAFTWIITMMVLVTVSTALAEEERPSATLVIEETQVMALIGGAMGGGTLLIDDDSHSFKTGGLKFGGVGVQKIHVTGNVYHLDKLKDFPGTYIEFEVGASVVKGAGELWLKNDKGVTLHLQSKSSGLAFDLSASGLKISMK